MRSATLAWKAARDGDEVSVRECLASGGLPSLEHADWTDSSPLYAAAAGGHLTCLNALALAGSPLDVRRVADLSPVRSLDRVSPSPQPHALPAPPERLNTCTRVLEDRALAPDTRTRSKPQRRMQLSTARPAWQLPNRGGKTPLFAACLSGKTACARALLKLGAAMDASDHEGVSPLMAAASEGHTECVRALLEYEADATLVGPLGDGGGGGDQGRPLLLRGAAAGARPAGVVRWRRGEGREGSTEGLVGDARASRWHGGRRWMGSVYGVRRQKHVDENRGSNQLLSISGHTR